MLSEKMEKSKSKIMILDPPINKTLKDNINKKNKNKSIKIKNSNKNKG